MPHKTFQKSYGKLVTLVKKLESLERAGDQPAHEAMNMLRTIAFHVRLRPAGWDTSDVGPVHTMDRIPSIGGPQSLNLVRTPKGEWVREYNAVLDEVIPALSCDLTRLRLCAVCKTLFVANRKDKRTCTAQCANTLRQKDFRDKVKRAQYKKNHQHNRAVKAARAARRTSL
jgi:hypothetical protein